MRKRRRILLKHYSLMKSLEEEPLVCGILQMLLRVGEGKDS